MTTYTFHKTSPSNLQNLKQEYVANITAPLDGMWEIFANVADHYAILSDGDTVGYFAVSSEQKLMQFYLPRMSDSRQVFGDIVSRFNISGAFVSTVEPAYLSLCLDRQKAIVVNALMYNVEDNEPLGEIAFPKDCEFRLVTKGELKIAVAFAMDALGADEGWLTGYYSEHIEKEQLYGLWQGQALIAAGELRKSASQKPYVDVGMVVAPQCRKSGLATTILRQLRRLAREHRLNAICSTEYGNIAAQKAISRAGFTSSHRVLEITF